MEWIKGFVKLPSERYGHMEMIRNSLEALQKKVGGYIEAVSIPGDMVVICSEEGRLEGHPHNCTINGIDFAGPIIVLGSKGEEFADIPMNSEEFIIKYL